MLKGLSPLVATVIVIFIAVIAIATTLLVIAPAINQAKESALLSEARQNMHQIDDMIGEISTEGLGSLRSLTFRVSGGQYRVNAPENAIDFVYSVKYGTVQAGTFIQDGNLQISAGSEAKASYYNLTTPRDGTGEIILENENIQVALHYNSSASATNPEAINTSNIIQFFNFISTKVNVTPSDSQVTIDDFPDSSTGSGYSYIVRTGDHLPSADAIVVVNTSKVYYQILYSLPSGADFLIVKIQNAYYQ